MYGLLLFIDNGEREYITFIHNEDGSIKTFETLNDADAYADSLDPDCEHIRVVSLECVYEWIFQKHIAESNYCWRR